MAKVAYMDSPDENNAVKGARRKAPSENVNKMKAGLRSSGKAKGKSGNGRHKVGDGNPFASALKAGKK